MSFLAYLKTLAPSFRKDDVIENLNLIRQSIKEHTLPAYVSADKFFINNKAKSQFFKVKTRDYEAATGKRIAGNRTLVTLVKENLENALVFLDALEIQAKSTLNPIEANLGITYTKVTILRLIEAVYFFNNYAGSFLNQLLIEETKENENDIKLDADLKKPEIFWLNKHWQDFCKVVYIIDKDAKKLAADLGNLPQAFVTDLTEATFESTLGVKGLDPLGVQGLSVEASPLFRFAMWKASSQAENYKAKKEELDLLQLRLYNLQKLFDGKNDLQTQNQITRLQSRVSSLHSNLATLGEKYGL